MHVHACIHVCTCTCRVGDRQMLRGYFCMSQEFFLSVQGLAFCLEAFIGVGLWVSTLCLSRQRAIATV